MRIVILAKSGSWGGAEAHAVQLVGVLAARGHAVQLTALDDRTYRLYQSYLPDEGLLKCLLLPKDPNRMGFRDWLTALKGIRADACLLVKCTLLKTGSLALDLAARAHFQRFITIEQLMPFLPAKVSRRWWGLLPGLGLWWYRLAWSGFCRSLAPHKVIAVSRAVRNALTQAYRFPPRKVVVVHNGVNPGNFRRNTEHCTAARRKLGLPRNGFVFGGVGRLIADKGFDLALRAFASLTAKYPSREMSLVLVGEGTERANLEKLAAQLGLAGKVLFPGFMKNPLEAYCSFDVFLLPSRRGEGLPLVLVEAMAAECCPIATGIAGTPEVITDPSLGWLVRPDDPGALLEAMEAALGAGEAERAAVRRRVREHVVRHFNSQVQLEKIAQILENGHASASGRAEARR